MEKVARDLRDSKEGHKQKKHYEKPELNRFGRLEDVVEAQGMGGDGPFAGSVGF